MSFIPYPRIPRSPMPIPWLFAEMMNSFAEGFTHFLKNSLNDLMYSEAKQFALEHCRFAIIRASLNVFMNDEFEEQ